MGPVCNKANAILDLSIGLYDQDRTEYLILHTLEIVIGVYDNLQRNALLRCIIAIGREWPLFEHPPLSLPQCNQIASGSVAR